MVNVFIMDIRNQGMVDGGVGDPGQHVPLIVMLVSKKEEGSAIILRMFLFFYLSTMTYASFAI